MQALNDTVRLHARETGTASLRDVHITLFHPVRMMLRPAGDDCRHDQGTRQDHCKSTNMMDPGSVS